VSDNILKDVFNNFLQGSKLLFKNREVLRPDYIPNFLPHRNNQIIQIGKILAPVLQGSRGSNIIIYGKTGTGKTAVIKYVVDHLINKSVEINSNIVASYINCRMIGTEYRIFANLCEKIDIEIPFTGLSTKEVFDRFKKGLKSKNISFIVVLDEVDALVLSTGDNILYDLTRINEYLNQSRLSIICISNDLNFKDLLDPRILSSLGEEELVFPSYVAPEIYDILFERIKIAFNEGAVTSGALNLCAALISNEYGDIRRALDLLRIAGEIAERNKLKNITDNYIRIAKKKMDKDKILTILETLPIHSKLVLSSIFLLTNEGIKEPKTGNVYEVYNNLCNQINVNSLSQRRISSLINELNIINILNTKVISLGRYGRTKKILLKIPQNSVKEVYSKDPWISKFFLKNQ
jgi:cell division control protein 6